MTMYDRLGRRSLGQMRRTGPSLFFFLIFRQMYKCQSKVLITQEGPVLYKRTVTVAAQAAHSDFSRLASRPPSCDPVGIHRSYR